MPPSKKQKRSHHALLANNRANEICASESGPSDEQVFEVLELLDMEKNRYRTAVLRQADKAEGVRSQLLGLRRNRISKDLEVASETAVIDGVCKLLCKWVRNWARGNGVAFAFTSIQLNKDFACDRHRDKGNLGPSIIRALGEHSGGELLYWPNDSKGKLENLDEKDAIILDVRNSFQFMDGRRAHEVLAFKGGTRYSVVFFTIDGHRGADERVKQVLQDAGFEWPTDKAILAMEHHLANRQSNTNKGALQKPLWELDASAQAIEMHGFINGQLNGKYSKADDRKLNGHPVYISGDSQHFLYIYDDKLRICERLDPDTQEDRLLLDEFKGNEKIDCAQMRYPRSQANDQHTWIERGLEEEFGLPTSHDVEISLTSVAPTIATPNVPPMPRPSSKTTKPSVAPSSAAIPNKHQPSMVPLAQRCGSSSSSTGELTETVVEDTVEDIEEKFAYTEIIDEEPEPCVKCTDSLFCKRCGKKRTEAPSTLEKEEIADPERGGQIVPSSAEPSAVRWPTQKAKCAVPNAAPTSSSVKRSSEDMTQDAWRRTARSSRPTPSASPTFHATHSEHPTAPEPPWRKSRRTDASSEKKDSTSLDDKEMTRTDESNSTGASSTPVKEESHANETIGGATSSRGSSGGRKRIRLPPGNTLAVSPEVPERSARQEEDDHSYENMLARMHSIFETPVSELPSSTHIAHAEAPRDEVSAKQDIPCKNAGNSQLHGCLQIATQIVRRRAKNGKRNLEVCDVCAQWYFDHQSGDPVCRI